LITEYGRLSDQALSAHQRCEQITTIIVELLQPWAGAAIRRSSGGLTNADRLVFVLDGQPYLLEVVWSTEPLSADVVTQFLNSVANAPRGPRCVLLSMSDFDQHVAGDTAQAGFPSAVLLNRAHLEALVCGLLTPTELFDAAYDHAFVTGRALVSLTDLLVQEPSEPPARMFRPDQLAVPHQVITSTGGGVDAAVALVGAVGWGQPSGLAMRAPDSLLVTTERGIVEVDAYRGTSFWLLPMPGCHGAPLVLPDGSVLVLCRTVVLRWKDDVLEPVAGEFTGPTMLLSGPNSDPWVLSGTGATFGAGTGTLALTRLGSHAGQQHRYDIQFDAVVRAAGWLDHRRFFLAASGHSAVVDLDGRSTVEQSDWIQSPQGYPGHLLVIDANTVATASPEGSGTRATVCMTDATCRNHQVVAELAVNSVYGLAAVSDGRAYLLADVRGNDPNPAPILVRLLGLFPPVPTKTGQSPSLQQRASEPNDPYRAVRAVARGERQDYRLEHRPIERGGQATVFRATHKSTDTPVAFKKLTGHTSDAIARMEREVDIARRLGGHPHVMPVLDHSNTHDWFVMPLAEGTAETLREELTQPANLRAMVTSICDALRSAHDRDWLHRDVKPANVLNLDRRWVLADWGLARRPRGQTTNPNRTQTGVLHGTEGFAAPELAIDAHRAGPAADIYSVGQLIGWLLLDRWPQPNIPLIPDGPWLDIVTAATHHDPTRRPTDIDTFLALMDDTADVPTNL
jgi:hypothetical protein